MWNCHKIYFAVSVTCLLWLRTEEYSVFCYVKKCRLFRSKTVKSLTNDRQERTSTMLWGMFLFISFRRNYMSNIYAIILSLGNVKKHIGIYKRLMEITSKAYFSLIPLKEHLHSRDIWYELRNWWSNWLIGI